MKTVLFLMTILSLVLLTLRHNRTPANDSKTLHPFTNTSRDAVISLYVNNLFLLDEALRWRMSDDDYKWANNSLGLLSEFSL